LRDAISLRRFHANHRNKYIHLNDALRFNRVGLYERQPAGDIFSCEKLADPRCHPVPGVLLS